MSRKTQQNEQEELRPARFVTIRALTAVGVVTALVVSSAAVASAGTPENQPPRSAVIVLIGANDYGLVAKPPPGGATSVVTNNNDPDKLGRVHAGGAREIDVPSVKDTAVNAMFFPWDMASKARPKPRGHQLTTGIPDGTSNTMMWSGSLRPPNGIIAILIG